MIGFELNADEYSIGIASERADQSNFGLLPFLKKCYILPTVTSMTHEDDRTQKEERPTDNDSVTHLSQHSKLKG